MRYLIEVHCVNGNVIETEVNKQEAISDMVSLAIQDAINNDTEIFSINVSVRFDW